MNPVNIERHYQCPHYTEGANENGMYRYLKIEPKEKLEVKTTEEMALVFVNSYDTLYTIGAEVNETRNSPFGVFLDNDKTLNLTIMDGGTVAIFRFMRLNELCNNYSISNLKSFAPVSMVHRTLEIYEPLRNVLNSIEYYYLDGLMCQGMMEWKLKEILWVIGAYYKPEIIGEIFAPLLRREVDFKEFVYQNHAHAKSVQELADMRGISIRTFNKVFKDTFNTPPYTWMLEQKAILIEERLADPTVSFQEIMEEFRFSSPSHFTVFCRRQYGKTPTQHRRELIRKEAEERAAARRARAQQGYYRE